LQPQSCRRALRTRQVKVNAVERREYIEEEPIISVGDDETAQPEWTDPFAAFSEIVVDNQQATIHIWRLPNFDQDGRTSPNGTNREYCGSVLYQDDDDTLLHQIQQRVPLGGVVSLELKQGGTFQKSGLLRLTKPLTAPASTQQSFPPITINQPAQVQQGMNQLDLVTQQFDMVEKVVGLAQKLIPPAPIINTGEQQPASSNGDKPLEDRIFEALALKALESDKVPMDRLLEALSGRRSEPSIWESIAPIIGEVIKAFAPSINAVIQRQVANAPGATQPAGIAPAQLGAPIEQEPAPGDQPPPVIDPVQRDWFQAMIRLLEDCTRHVELASVGGGSKSVLPSAEAILELAERYPEQLGSTIQILLVASPIEVLDSCAMMLDERGRAHIETALKPFPSSLAWISELQAECKRILADATAEEPTDDGIPSND